MDINKILKEELNREYTNFGIGGDIDEAIITLGNKLYPNNGNGVIFAGGSGSGKGFVKDNLLGIEGKVLDSDKLKTLYMNSLKLRNSLKSDYGLNIDTFDFKNPEDVRTLHNILTTKGIGDKQEQVLLNNIKNLKNKPNLIFDTTLSTVTKFYNIAKIFEDMGYDKQHIHLVWVLTDFETALVNNNSRKRVVPEIVFTDIHKGVSRTMKEILSLNTLNNLIDGDIYLVFNNPTTDTIVKKGSTNENTFGTAKPQYIESANYVKLKNAGEPLKSYAEINAEVIAKINQYVHTDTQW